MSTTIHAAAMEALKEKASSLIPQIVENIINEKVTLLKGFGIVATPEIYGQIYENALSKFEYNLRCYCQGFSHIEELERDEY